ncbi:hypothetical protein C5S31_06030 [ANME-1 cluster archaeon GoMg2]|jgi:hypothetical protein|nr:hypothetical protein [ANME-1 cluster archaeon GoMg2]
MIYLISDLHLDQDNLGFKLKAAKKGLEGNEFIG